MEELLAQYQQSLADIEGRIEALRTQQKALRGRDSAVIETRINHLVDLRHNLFGSIRMIIKSLEKNEENV